MSAGEFALVGREERYRGPLFAVRTDQVRMPDGEIAGRDYLAEHPGAVAVVAYDVDADAVLLVRQYRHPLGEVIWELPAGLLDVVGEPARESARRELAEEADLRAARWDVLVDLAVSPGCSDERIRIYLARDVDAIPEAQRHVRTAEESTMTTEWVAMNEALGRVFAGQIVNATCVAGLLAAARARDAGFAALRPVDAVWPSHGSATP